MAKIYNFNHPFTPEREFGLWNTWRKYIDELNIKTNSLFDYTWYFSPQYKIINATDNEYGISDIIVDTDSYYCVLAGTNHDIPVYFPTRLWYRQGFLNNNIDGYLFLDDPKDFDPNNFDPEDNSVFQKFLSGYVCISNIQETNGIDNEESESRKDISNYLIYPIGNGAYFRYNFYNNSINANYFPNELGSFTAKSVFNFSLTPLRYINEFSWEKDTSNRLINSVNDKDGNSWTGSKIIVPQLYMGNEELFDDVSIDFSFSVSADYEYIPTILLSSTTPLKLTNVKIHVL